MKKHKEEYLSGGYGIFSTIFCYCKDGPIVYHGRISETLKKTKKHPICHMQIVYHINGGSKNSTWTINKVYGGVFLEKLQKNSKKLYKFSHQEKINHLLSPKRPKWYLIRRKEDKNFEILGSWRKLPKTYIDVFDLIENNIYFEA